MRAVKSPNLDLRELQSWLRWIITDPRGVSDALGAGANAIAHPRYKAPGKCVLQQLCVPAGIDLASRLDVYAEAYFSRLHDSLAEDFPATARLLDGIDFQRLVADYLKEYPSRTPTMTEVGRHLPIFIREYQRLKSIEFLPELISLEWRAIEIYFMDPEATLDLGKLTSQDDFGWSEARFKINPSTKIVSSDWDLSRLWSWRENGREIENLPERGNERDYLLFRDKSGDVRLERMSIPQSYLIRELIAGSPLSDTLFRLEGSHLAPLSSDEIMHWFNKLIADGLINDIVKGSI